MIICQNTLNCQVRESIDFVAREEVIQSIRQAKCHTLIIIDESNDISSTKMLILYIKYCTADGCRLLTKTVFAGIMPLSSCNSQSILEEIKKFYTTNNIDIQNMIMFKSDGAAVMLGKRNGVAKLLQNSVPHLVEQHCVAHHEDLGIDDAWSKVSLMQDIETLVRTIYTMFSRSSVKKQGLQAIAQASGHNLISFKAIHDGRWLFRHFAIQALVRNYDVLLEYCKEQGTRDPVAVFCIAKLESMQIKAALFVLNDILTELADLSRTFQKSDITPMEAQAVAYSKIAKLQAQYLGEHKHWSATVQDLINKSTLTMEEMAPVVRFIERLCTHLKDRFPDDDKLSYWCIFDYSCIKQVDFDFGLNELEEHLKQFSCFFHCHGPGHESNARNA